MRQSCNTYSSRIHLPNLELVTFVRLRGIYTAFRKVRVFYLLGTDGGDLDPEVDIHFESCNRFAIGNRADMIDPRRLWTQYLSISNRVVDLVKNAKSTPCLLYHHPICVQYVHNQ